MSNHNTGETMIKKIYAVHSVNEDGRASGILSLWPDREAARVAARQTTVLGGLPAPVLPVLVAEVAPGVFCTTDGDLFVNGESYSDLTDRGRAMFAAERNRLRGKLTDEEWQFLKALK